MLEKELIFCPIGLPGEGERKEFLEQSLEDIPCGQGFSYKRMAEMTEGFNYGKLDQAVSLAALFITHQINFLFGKDPQTRAEALGQNLAVLEEKSFQQIVDHLRAENSVSLRQAVPRAERVFRLIGLSALKNSKIRQMENQTSLYVMEGL